ncbi:MAG: hypothetical protein ACI857_001642 [Arenicella sp.]|jgi:hypothetical protein
MASNEQQLFYRPVIGRLYIIFGILFIGIFIMGLIILQDWTNIIYALASSFLIYIGYSVLKKPYASYSEKDVVLYSFYGKTRNNHTFLTKKDLKVTENNIFLNDKKLKMNSWFLRPADWRRLQEFFDTEENVKLLSELQD